MLEEKETISEGNIQLERLLSKNETLYGKSPSVIAKRVEDKLREISEEEKEVISVFALPEYHTWYGDGGTKDICFITKPQAPGSPKVYWRTERVLKSDQKTMYAWETPKIMKKLHESIQELEQQGYQVRHIIALTDTHEAAVAMGIGGYDGTKNLILSYHK